MNKKACPALIAGVLLVSFTAITSAQAEDFRGKVTKQAVRVARPTDADQSVTLKVQTSQAAPIAGKVSDDGFVLNGNTLNPKVSIEGWSPFAASVQKAKATPAAQAAPPKAADVTTAAAEIPVVDYEAIEKAYAEAVPRVAPPHIQGGVPECSPQIAASAWATQAAASGRLAANGTLMVPQGGAAPTVDVDNCVCATPIPTSNCVQGRMQGFGTNVAPTAAVTMPGRPQVAPPQITGGRWQPVLPASVRAAR